MKTNLLTPDVVIITEKPEVGLAICNALLTGVKREGPHERTGWFGEKFFWIFDTDGNPFRLEEPQEIKPQLEKWSNLDALLPIPKYPKTIPAKNRKGFLESIKKKCKPASEIVIATDSDLEGECIGFDVSNYAGVEAIASRVRLTSSLEAQDVIDAFSKRKPQVYYKSKFYAAQTKRISDWYWQFLVRAHTTIARSGGLGPGLDLRSHNKKQIISSGRVQTIAHSIIYQHHKNRTNHISVSYFKLTCQSQYGTIEYIPPIAPSDSKHIKLSRKGIRLLSNQSSSTKLFSALSDIQALDITKIEKSEEKKYPPPPFDALGLQQVSSKVFGWSATKTLKVADRLRLKGHITYVRTDDCQLPMSLIDSGRIQSRLKLLSTLPGISDALEQASKYLTHSKPKCFTNNEIDHHGIIPSDKTPDFSSLPADEFCIYELVTRRFIMALLPPLQTINKRFYLSTTVLDPIGHSTCKFRLNTSEVVCEGFTSMKSHERESQDTSSLEKGFKLSVFDWKLDEKHTKPDSPLKLPDLLGQMRRPSLLCSDESTLRDLSESRGIGTAATRHQAIDKVLARNYSAIDETGSYSPTQFGISYSETINSQLADVTITARLERTLIEIESSATPELARSLMVRALSDSRGFISNHITNAIQGAVTNE